MGYRWLLLGLGLWMAVIGWAQQDQKSPSSSTSPAPPRGAVGVHDPNFLYTADRDPFEMEGRPPDGGKNCRPVRSVADLLVGEIVLLGIFQRGGKYQALVRGAGLKGSTTITVGQKLCNGDLIEIGPYTDETASVEATGRSPLLCAVFRVQTDDPIRPFIRQVKCIAAS
ncbi:hypothetical protein HRbin11_02225 [bacterium HR11]|nr:hypothetical protein HRbin11_02225 [bacterium HR11]